MSCEGFCKLGGKTFTYDYDASRSKHKYAGDTVTIKYAGRFEYNSSNTFKRVATSEGQLVLSVPRFSDSYLLLYFLFQQQFFPFKRGHSAGYKIGAGVVTDNNAEFGIKFRVPANDKKP